MLFNKHVDTIDMGTTSKCDKCGKEVPTVNRLYHYKVDTSASLEFCTECFDVLVNSLTLKPQYKEKNRR